MDRIGKEICVRQGQKTLTLAQRTHASESRSLATNNVQKKGILALDVYSRIIVVVLEEVERIAAASWGSVLQQYCSQ